MADDSFQEKTEDATPKKREKSREDGQVAKSMEVSSVFVLLAGVLVLYALGFFSYDRIIEIMRVSFKFTTIPDLDIKYLTMMLMKFSIQFLISLTPIFMAVFFMALISNFIQVGFVISFKAIEPDIGKISIIKGFGRLFSMKSLVNIVKETLKLFIIGIVAYYILKGQVQKISLIYNKSVAGIMLYLFKNVFRIYIWVIVVMVLVALLDYIYQRWQFDQQIKMTKQEIKDEFKQSEGDPQVKSRIKSLQQQAAKKRMMQEVPKADVVVTNPTHLSIAIKYDVSAMNAPSVVAKGAGILAQKIKEVARENHVPIVESKELAQKLYKLVDIGEEVPVEFFKAVAEILAYVYKLKGKSV